MTRIAIAHSIAIDEGLIEERFLRASGPRRAERRTSVERGRRFDATRAHFSADMRAPRHVGGQAATEAGILIIDAQRFRTQERGRADAREHLLVFSRAATPPKPRTRRAYRRRESAQHIGHEKAQSKVQRTCQPAPRRMKRQ